MKNMRCKEGGWYKWNHITDKRAATLKLIKEFGECIKG
tara:strand:- start:23 stop:136 length:114 start_codon:yes stop_codon:yes gene_type:complete